MTDKIIKLAETVTMAQMERDKYREILQVGCQHFFRELENNYGFRITSYFTELILDS